MCTCVQCTCLCVCLKTFKDEIDTQTWQKAAPWVLASNEQIRFSRATASSPAKDFARSTAVDRLQRESPPEPFSTSHCLWIAWQK